MGWSSIYYKVIRSYYIALLYRHYLEFFFLDKFLKCIQNSDDRIYWVLPRNFWISVVNSEILWIILLKYSHFWKRRTLGGARGGGICKIHTVGEKKDSTLHRAYGVKLPLLRAVWADQGLILPLEKWINFFLCLWLLVCQFIDISNQIEITGEVSNIERFFYNIIEHYINFVESFFPQLYFNLFGLLFRSEIDLKHTILTRYKRKFCWQSIVFRFFIW